MIEEHWDGFLSLLTTPGNITVYAETVPDNPVKPYIVVYGNQGLPENASMDDKASLLHFTYRTTKVGVSKAQVRALADRELAALLDKRPTVAGRSCGQISKLSSQDIRPDNDVSPPVLFGVDTWTFISVPA